nr:hypothetical protein [Thiomicrorhabdus aquaedulcis]
MHPWLGYQPIHLAQQHNLLPAEFSLIHTTSALQTQQKLRNAELDAGYLTLDEVLLLKEQGVDLTIVLVTNVSTGADKILARQPNQTKHDIIGKTLAYEAGAVAN